MNYPSQDDDQSHNQRSNNKANQHEVDFYYVGKQRDYFAEDEDDHAQAL